MPPAESRAWVRRAVADLAPALTTPKADIPWTRVLGENPERLLVAVG